MGNKTADQLAKGGSKLPELPSTISYEKVKSENLWNTATQELQEENKRYTFRMTAFTDLTEKVKQHYQA